MKVAVRTAELEISIKVKPSTGTSEVAEPEENELEIKGDTLKEVLTELSDRYDYQLIDSQTEELNPVYAVLVNGKYYQFLPKGISTKLKEGDEIDIILILFGGG